MNQWNPDNGNPFLLDDTPTEPIPPTAAGPVKELTDEEKHPGAYKLGQFIGLCFALLVSFGILVLVMAVVLGLIGILITVIGAI
ncbi:hypothetical protein AXJ10_gp51 [Gordonia phage GordTnk2]|nr:hypothetical protein AXJ10_gp51 [Gordonia phage GordTnk2]AKC02791.1 hypothetical protein GordTnk2_51 [Gordonia phage GordTnk2]